VDMSVDSLVSIYVSMGVTTPEFFAQKTEPSARRLDSAD
jgi:uncharacterized membrane protein